MTYVCFLVKCSELRYNLEQVCEQPCAHAHIRVCMCGGSGLNSLNKVITSFSRKKVMRMMHMRKK